MRYDGFNNIITEEKRIILLFILLVMIPTINTCKGDEILYIQIVEILNF